MKSENYEQPPTEWIERYLSGELEGEELNRFTQQLQTDSNLSQELRIHQSIAAQARQVGRAELRTKLKSMHQRLVTTLPAEFPRPSHEQNFVAETVAVVPAQTSRFSFAYAVAASVALLLIALLGIWHYRQQSTLTQQVKPAPSTTQSLRPYLATIRLDVRRQAPDLGFSGTSADTTILVLIYPSSTGTKLYQFDDTLRLYGSFTPARLALHYDPSVEEYVLREGETSYFLQRHQSRQPLRNFSPKK